MNSTKRFFLAVGAVLLCRDAIHAESLPIRNGSFEEVTGDNAVHFLPGGSLRDGHYASIEEPFDGLGIQLAEAVPGWMGGGVAGSMAPRIGEGPETEFGLVPQGRITAFTGSDSYLDQTLTRSAEANTRYVFKAEVGRPRSSAGEPAWAGAGLLISAGGFVMATALVPTGMVPGEFRTVEASYTVSPGDPTVGKPIAIGLFSGFVGTAHFDNVRLEAEALVVPTARITPAVEISWLSRTNEWYRIERAVSVTGAEWVPVAAPFKGTGNRIAFFETAATNAGYYRLVPVPPP
jgi:hypothetical protein